jgi:hypothetical protein
MTMDVMDIPGATAPTAEQAADLFGWIGSKEFAERTAKIRQEMDALSPAEIAMALNLPLWALLSLSAGWTVATERRPIALVPEAPALAHSGEIVAAVAGRPIGFFIDAEGRVGLGTSQGTILVEMTATEMRNFAAALEREANRQSYEMLARRDGAPRPN